MAGIVDVPARTGNRPAAIQRFQAMHDLRQIFDEDRKSTRLNSRHTAPSYEVLFTGDNQAACDFSFSASKFSPFFHRVSAMAAILRASVRRTIVGLMPLASDLW